LINFSLNKNESSNFNFEEYREGNPLIDIPMQVNFMFYEGEHILLNVSWKDRNDGITPENTLVDYSYIRTAFPILLIEYYEQAFVKHNKLKKHIY